jgi:hypothetical protein
VIGTGAPAPVVRSIFTSRPSLLKPLVFFPLLGHVHYDRHMSMHIVVGLIVAAALAPLFLLIPAIALQTLLRLITPAPARRFPMTAEQASYVPIEEGPPRSFDLLRAES